MKRDVNFKLSEIEQRIFQTMLILQKQTIQEIFLTEDDIALLSNYSHAIVRQALNRMLDNNLVTFKPCITYFGDYFWRTVE
jgi:transcription initiation factor IIE alpha subunit